VFEEAIRIVLKARESKPSGKATGKRQENEAK
jgi:hypothetical protein